MWIFVRPGRGTWTTPRQMAVGLVVMLVVVFLTVLIGRSDMSFTVKSWAVGGMFFIWFEAIVFSYYHFNPKPDSSENLRTQEPVTRLSRKRRPKTWLWRIARVFLFISVMVVLNHSSSLQFLYWELRTHPWAIQWGIW